MCPDEIQPCIKCGKVICECFPEGFGLNKYEKSLIKTVKDNGVMRQFASGATRNSDEGKYDYEGFLSPLVIERYAQYMNRHRKQADGKLRDSDNWQKGFGDKHLDVCMKSAWRHFMDMWKQHRGYPGQDTLEDSICALNFNINAYLHKILKDKLEKNKENSLQKGND